MQTDQEETESVIHRRAPQLAVVRSRAITKAMSLSTVAVGELQVRVSLLLARNDFLTNVGRPDPRVGQQIEIARASLDEVVRKFEADVLRMPESYRTDTRILRLRKSLDSLLQRLGGGPSSTPKEN